jgi:hypothetical protein
VAQKLHLRKAKNMSTTAQVLANRENAKLSTGPKSDIGKRKSSQNATTHGFYSKAFIVRADEKADFELLREELVSEYRPIDTTAEDLFQQILHASWNLHRLRRMENEIYVGSDDPFGDEKVLRRLDALRRHKGHFERSLRSARKTLTEHTTSIFNLVTIPPDIRDHFNPAVDASVYHRAQAGKWKVYRPEDFVSEERLEAARAEDKERSAVVDKKRGFTAPPTVNLF